MEPTLSGSAGVADYGSRESVSKLPPSRSSSNVRPKAVSPGETSRTRPRSSRLGKCPSAGSPRSAPGRTKGRRSSVSGLPPLSKANVVRDQVEMRGQPLRSIDSFRFVCLRACRGIADEYSRLHWPICRPLVLNDRDRLPTNVACPEAVHRSRLSFHAQPRNSDGVARLQLPREPPAVDRFSKLPCDLRPGSADN